MCYGAVAEAVPVANAAGVALTHEESRKILDLVTGPAAPAPTSRVSVSTSSTAGPTEVGVINGAVVARGVLYGIDTPINATLVALVKGIESHYLPL